MPIGKIKRNLSYDTLSSLGMDSTIDSRISSTDIPKMELLQLSYVQQCKEALTQQKPIEPPAFLAHLQSHQQKQLKQALTQHQQYKKVTFKTRPTQRTSEANVTKITLGSRPMPPSPPSPPTIESWKLLQTNNKADPKAAKHNVHENSSYSSDSSDQGTDSTMSPGCERSNSWNYRTKCSTLHCDIRRDAVRAGVKSRADRIARIEHTECDHRTSMPTSPMEAVSKINKIFENATKMQQSKTNPPPPPPQPSRPAPIPRKEPNARRNAANRRSGNESDTDLGPPCSLSSRSRFASRIPKPINDYNSNRTATASTFLFNETNEQYQRRIKQMFVEPESAGEQCQCGDLNFASSQLIDVAGNSTSICDQGGAGGGAPLNDLLRINRQVAGQSYQKMKIERVHIRKKRQPLLIINQLKSEDESPKPTPTSTSTSPSSTKECENSIGSGSVVRLVNALEQKFNSNSERRTCGYKNCNFANCPMSTTTHHNGDDRRKESDKLKRLSLESNSDSGVSTSHDAKGGKIQEHNHSRKSLEKCEDCVQLLQSKSSSKSGTAAAKSKSLEHEDEDRLQLKGFKLSSPRSSRSPQPEPDKLKRIESNQVGRGGNQIKIHIGKSHAAHNADPNDVQNFSKKNLTKTTTDEMLTAALKNSSVSKASKSKSTKQCNIENDRKNNLRQQRTTMTTIRVDDDWVQEPLEPMNGGGEFIDTDSLMPSTPTPPPPPPALSDRKPINANDNCVKIFVRSSSSNIGGCATRASSVSANSYASHTSGCSSISSHSSIASTSSSTSSVSFSSSSPHHHDIDCCTQMIVTPPVVAAAGGVYFNNSSQLSDFGHFGNHNAASNISQRACPPSPMSTLDCRLMKNSKKRAIVKPQDDAFNDCCSDAVDGVFWNNSYFCNDHPDGDCTCCCSLSSCDDDNCSYYETNHCNADGHGVGVGSIVVIDSSADYRKERPRTIDRVVDRMDGCERRLNSPTRFHNSRKQPEQRISSAEEILIRNKKLMRKTDVIHELRPRSMDGVADSGVSLSGDTGSSPDSSEHMQNQQQDSESRRLKRGHVLTELLETERIYVSEMSSILKGYCDQMQSEEMMHLVPASLQGKEDILFGNLHELYTFHNEIFLKDLENCISTTELVALCFVQRRDTFYRLYSFYCQNIPRSDRLRETLVDTHLFLQECQKRLGHKLPLGAYLLKPVQRITKYQLLLKDLLRFSDSGNCTKELQKALDCMLIVLKCVNDSMHQVAITGFPTDLTQQGELLLQDSFQVWTESKKDIRLRIKPQQRHIFLYQKSMLFCKQTSKPGHNKSTYQFKHHVKMSQIGLTESVRGDVKRFEVWLQGRQEVHTLQASTLEIKNKWVAEIKRVLLNQLEELKGEKIKQYGLSHHHHRGLKQTTSWDTPNIILGAGAAATQRTLSCDQSSESSNRNSNCSGSSGDDNCSASGVSVIQTTAAPPPPNVTTNPAEKEPHEGCGWSSDYSNSEDEMSIIEDNSTPKFMNFLAQWSYSNDGSSYPPRNSKSNSKFYVSVEQ